MSHRPWSGCLLVLAACCALAPTARCAPTAADSRLRTTGEGAVEGVLLPGGVRAWLGIPYAAAPVRERRWRPPDPPPRHATPLHADRKAPECIQVLRPHDINHYFGEEATSEDCLYLNIWAPADARAGVRLPVVVFIHGGGFTIGSGGMALYDGAQVARDGVVFVNFNYRLGILGFLAHPELTAESDRHASGDYGFLDQIAALHWIHDNIRAFGGDPGRVVVVGQSAGALSASLLQVSPLARGLFRGIVALSGSAWGGPSGFGAPATLAEAERTGLQLQEALGAHDLASLRRLPADRLLAQQKDCQLGCSGTVRVSPVVVDGWFLPDQPDVLMARGVGSDVPVVIGVTRDDLDVALVDGARNWALAQSRLHRSRAWLCMFTHVQPFNLAATASDHPESVGAYHTSDVPYWFGTLDALNLFRPTRLWRAEDRLLSARMRAALVAFAASGDPSTQSLPWRAWRADDDQLLALDVASRTVPIEAARAQFRRQTPPAAGDAAGPGSPRD